MADRSGRFPNRLILAIGAAVLVGVGGLIGIAVAGEEETKHTGSEPLKATNIGNPEVGRHLFVSQRCSACHSFQGRGGSDAPPLDYMRDKMAAKDIAEMSGQIWNHVPAMVRFFREEDIPFPSFSGDEMADLIAYLHGGGPPPDVGKTQMEDGHEP
jgi:mono/diheme cytochrome c family protein